jgi:hypothetical protein
MNRNILTTLLILLTSLLAVSALAQDDVTFGPGQGHGICQFIDEDGDGFNDLAPDADGDGIPNGMDEDYVKPEDGTGNMFRFGRNADALVKAFGEAVTKAMNGNGHGYGLGDGSGTGEGPADGTGFGPGTGDCLDGDDVLLGTSTLQQRRGGRR